MGNSLFEVRAAARKVQVSMIQFGQENGFTEDAMCIILKDVLGFFEAECSRGYADSILQLDAQNKALSEKLERSADDNTNVQS
jgi:hypothetical protein